MGTHTKDAQVPPDCAGHSIKLSQAHNAAEAGRGVVPLGGRHSAGEH
jgi:hypothetical protein